MSRARLALLDPYAAPVEALWRGLEERARPPYFLSWAWVENWLACLPRAEAPPLAVIRDREGPRAAFFLGRRRLVRHGLLPSRALFLNVTGLGRRDELCIEHNAVLCAPEAAWSLAELLELIPGGWDELFLPAVARDGFPGRSLGQPLPRHRVRIDRELVAPFIDLSRVRAAEGGYLSLLGAGTRAQIRRAQRGFGTLALEAAGDERHGLDIYDELVHLHGQRWRARGVAGAFADPWFDRFHRRLIARRIGDGEIQLLRMRAGGATVGCLYNLVGAGRVLFYQSGLSAFADPHLKPGYVCHAEAVRHNAAAGHAVYDLLGGASRYKRSLATDGVRLIWARVQRPLARFAVEEALRRCKRALLGWCRRS